MRAERRSRSIDERCSARQMRQLLGGGSRLASQSTRVRSLQSSAVPRVSICGAARAAKSDVGALPAHDHARVLRYRDLRVLTELRCLKPRRHQSEHASERSGRRTELDSLITAQPAEGRGPAQPAFALWQGGRRRRSEQTAAVGAEYAEWPRHHCTTARRPPTSSAPPAAAAVHAMYNHNPHSAHSERQSEWMERRRRQQSC